MSQIRAALKAFPPEYYIEIMILLIVLLITDLKPLVTFIVASSIFVIISIPMIFGNNLNYYFYTPITFFTKRKWIMQKPHILLKNNNAQCPSHDLYRRFRSLLKSGALEPGIEYVALTHRKIISLIDANPACFEYVKAPKLVYLKDVNKIKKQLSNKNCTKENCKQHPCWKGKDLQEFYHIRFKVKPIVKFHAKYPQAEEKTSRGEGEGGNVF